MPDHEESTPQCPSTDPPKWKELSPFRETFLQYLTDAPTREALLHLGDEAYQMVLEWRHFWPEREGSSIRHDLQAVMADLVYLAGYLEHQIGGHLGKSSLSEEERKLATTARHLATEVSAMAIQCGVVLSGKEQGE